MRSLCARTKSERGRGARRSLQNRGDEAAGFGCVCGGALVRTGGDQGRNRTRQVGEARLHAQMVAGRCLTGDAVRCVEERDRPCGFGGGHRQRLAVEGAHEFELRHIVAGVVRDQLVGKRRGLPILLDGFGRAAETEAEGRAEGDVAPVEMAGAPGDVRFGCHAAFGKADGFGDARRRSGSRVAGHLEGEGRQRGGWHRLRASAPPVRAHGRREPAASRARWWRGNGRCSRSAARVRRPASRTPRERAQWLRVCGSGILRPGGGRRCAGARGRSRASDRWRRTASRGAAGGPKTVGFTREPPGAMWPAARPRLR